jgi:glycosyltransferase involved in cell wall biosynthesis
MNSAKQSRVAIIVPALNESLAIRAVVESALAYCADVFVIDDGSSDDTAARISDLPIQLVRHSERMGKGRSLKDGMQAAFAAGFDAVISMDGDGQHSSEDVPRLLRAHIQHPRALLLCARLIGRETQPGLRRFANHFADFWVSWAAGQRVLDSQCGQRLYPRTLIESIEAPQADGFAFESEVLINASRAGFVIAALPIRARYHEGRRASHFQPLRDVARITRMIFWKIVFRGLALPSLFRSLFRPALQLEP